MIIKPLAPYACLDENSRGRLYYEKDSKYRSIYGRDRDRIINCKSFRRLQYKTQVFVNHAGDFYRTRLTHSLEVAQIARWIADGLSVNKDLAEVVSLAHDLGHTPFGHAGERVLNAKMKNFGGFCHNAQALKIITKLEKNYIDFDGLNLSWEMLEGVVKHNGPLTDQDKINQYILEYNRIYDLDLERFPSIEAQIAGIADDIAYNNHDIEDGLRAELFKLNQLFDLPFIGSKFQKLFEENPNISEQLLVSEAKKRIVNDMVVDVIETSIYNIKKYNIKKVEDVRNCDALLVGFSEELALANKQIKSFLWRNMYSHYKVNRMTANATRIVGSLFDFFIKNPNCLPDKNQGELIEDEKELAITVSDYIAGMTDRFAIKEFNDLLRQ